MSDFGLLPEGFVPATISDVRAEIEDGLRSSFGASLPLGNRTLLGYMVGAVSERIALLWEVAELAFTSMDPDKATGAMLEALCLLTATFRAAAAASTVFETLCGDDGTLVAAGATFATASTGKKFDSFVDVTIAALAAWTPTTAYARGDRVTHSSRCYGCTIAGTSNGSGGPTTTAPDITDGTVHWTYLGEGAASVDVLCVAEDTGETVATAGDLTVIVNPILGLNSARNVLDANLGRDVMADQDLRLLREAELAEPGTGTPDAIRAALLLVDRVTHVTVFFNNTGLADLDGTVSGFIGLPAHSCAVLIEGGDDQNIFDTLWSNVPIGIGTIGTTTGTALDVEGNLQVVRFTRPTLVPAYLYITVKKNPRTYVGDSALRTAVATWGQGLGAGSSIEPSAISAQAFVTGVTQVTEVRVFTDVIAAGAPWVLGTGYIDTVGSRSVVTNDDRSYICVTGGVSDDGTPGHTGPYGVGTNIVDNAARWRFLGAPVPFDSLHLATYDTSRIVVVSTDA